MIGFDRFGAFALLADQRNTGIQHPGIGIRHFKPSGVRRNDHQVVQFHVDLDPALTLEEAHKIVVAAEERIRAEFPTADIIIHPDPRGRAEPHGHEHFEPRTRAG